MFGLKSKSKALLGVDVGSSAVKLIELKRNRSGISATVADLRELAAETVVDGAIVDSVSLASAISALLSENHVKNRAAASAVSGHSVIVKQISMPVMSDEELSAALQMEAAQHIPFELSDVNLDYYVLEAHENDTMDVLLVAVKKEKISSFTLALSQAGLVPAVMDHDPFAVQNCYEYNYEPSPQSTVALLNVGASVTNINVLKGTMPLFTRDLSIGGNQYTDALQKELNLTFEDAEAVKLGRNTSFPEARRNAVLQSVSETIRLEIQKTFDFFRASASGEHVDRIYLSGGSAQIAGLSDMLHQEFQVPVELLDPFRRIDSSSSPSSAGVAGEHGARMAVAVGLALRSFEDL
jgi:type IV pilus assembly protein PilM